MVALNRKPDTKLYLLRPLYGTDQTSGSIRPDLRLVPYHPDHPEPGDSGLMRRRRRRALGRRIDIFLTSTHEDSYPWGRDV